MTKAIVALFDDIVVARQVVEDLVSADYERSKISLITNDAHNQYSHYLDKDYAPREDAVTAAEGAGFGTVVGALTGVLVGLAALTIPGIGLAIVAGPIVAGLTGALAGAVTGGIVGALVKSGVPEDVAPYYAEGIRRGGTLISIQTTDTLRASDIMNRYGSINIHERSALWRQAGWKGFDTDSVVSEDSDKAAAALTGISSDVTTTRVTHITHNANPSPAAPVQPIVEAEAPIEDEDTAELPPMMEIAPSNEIAVPITPAADLLTAEPVMLAVEAEPLVDIEDRAKSLQDVELTINHSKG